MTWCLLLCTMIDLLKKYYSKTSDNHIFNLKPNNDFKKCIETIKIAFLLLVMERQNLTSIHLFVWPQKSLASCCILNMLYQHCKKYFFSTACSKLWMPFKKHWRQYFSKKYSTKHISSEGLSLCEQKTCLFKRKLHISLNAIIRRQWSLTFNHPKNTWRPQIQWLQM